MPPIRIGKLARMANVNVQTLRFYERKGLLPRPTRRPSGYREYPPQAIGIVKLIKHVQGLGFSLKEIKEFLLLRNKPSTTMAATCGGLERKIEEIDSRITELAAIRHTLAKMLEIHRQGGDALFAPAFDRHLERLVSEAMTGESDERSSQRRFYYCAAAGKICESHLKLLPWYRVTMLTRERTGVARSVVPILR